MKINLTSDIHLEFEDIFGFSNKDGDDLEFNPLDVESDVLVIAGDIHNGLKAAGRLRKWAEQRPVVIVLGNHCFWQNKIDELVDDYKELKIPNLHILENDEVVIQGVRFLGCTLWTDFNKGNPTAMGYAHRTMNDYPQIWINSFRRATPDDIYQIHLGSRAWLTKKLNEPFPGKTVVVTHHLPTQQVQHPRFRGDPIQFAYFSTDCEHLITKADLWLFGHQHDPIEETRGNTRLISHPRGYITELGVEKYKTKIIEL